MQNSIETRSNLCTKLGLPVICLGLADNTLPILGNPSDDTQPLSILLIFIPGVFRFIKDNFINSPSADLTPELMDMLMAVMLVYYQHVNSPCLFFGILFAPFLRIQLLISSILLPKPARLKKKLGFQLVFWESSYHILVVSRVYIMQCHKFHV